MHTVELKLKQQQSRMVFVVDEGEVDDWPFGGERGKKKETQKIITK